MPPVDVLRIGEICFVRGGQHRVSVARALGRRDINAWVTDVTTGLGTDHTITLADLVAARRRRRAGNTPTQ